MEMLHDHVNELSQCLFRNFVIQKVIQGARPEHIQSLIDEIYGSNPGVISIAKNRYGCRIIQRLFEFSRSDQVEPLVSAILARPWEVACDPYGKFVMIQIMQ